MTDNSTTRIRDQEPIHGIPEEILARRSAKFHEFVDFLGGVIREEGRGWRATCPACNRDTLHVSPTPDNRIGIRCHYCGGSAPRRVLKENGFDIPAPAPRPINHTEIEYWRRYWRSQGARPIEGTPAESYLASRAIHIKSFEDGTFHHLQFVPRAPFEHVIATAMVAWTYSTFGGDTYKPATVHVTYLRYDGLGKILVPDPRRTFGAFGSGIIFFVPDAARDRREREQYWCGSLAKALKRCFRTWRSNGCKANVGWLALAP